MPWHSSQFTHETQVTHTGMHWSMTLALIMFIELLLVGSFTLELWSVPPGHC